MRDLIADLSRICLLLCVACLLPKGHRLVLAAWLTAAVLAILALGLGLARWP